MTLTLELPPDLECRVNSDCARALSDFTAFHLSHNASPSPPLDPREQAEGEPAPAVTTP
jgi:hypothetical protein